MTIQQFRQSAIRQLSSSPSPALDVDVLLQWVLGKDRTFILFNRTQELTPQQESTLAESVSRRMTGLPIAYITGHKEFFGLDFEVNQSVLIPKPDTEVLVENAANFLLDQYAKNPRILTICDMCTGSGCVGISLLKFLCEEGTIRAEHIPAVTMCDISREALDTARKNADSILSKSQRQKMTFVHTNLFDNLGKTRAGVFDIIVSNPPYVPATETTELLKDGRSEPRLALDGDVNPDGTPSSSSDGLELIRRLIPQAKRFVIPGGLLILETGEYNAMATEEIMKSLEFRDTKLYYDLEGQLRNVSGIR